jgi:hypothetical protein
MLEIQNTPESQLQMKVNMALNCLKIGNSWKEFKPNNLKFGVDKSGNITFRARYGNRGFLLSWNDGDLTLTNIADNLNYKGQQISDLGEWLFNFNIDGCKRFLGEVQNLVSRMKLKNISNLITYVDNL